MNKLKLGISSCLLGNKVRYDGNHKHNHYITDVLGSFFEWIPVCPESECGLSVPRESMHLIKDHDNIQLITSLNRTDITPLISKWIIHRLNDLSNINLCGFIFKTKSPSCGLTDAKIFYKDGVFANKGAGIFAKSFVNRFPLTPVIDEGRLNDSNLRGNFIEQVLIIARWKECIKDNSIGSDLVRFHEKHKLVIMSHSQQGLKTLGKLVANCGKDPQPDLKNEYIHLLMSLMSLTATVKKQTNVLQHIAGHLKRQLNADQKLELQESIDNYHKGLVPLMIPLTLLQHYVRMFNHPYLKNQVYLHPHQIEIISKSHL